MNIDRFIKDKQLLINKYLKEVAGSIKTSDDLKKAIQYAVDAGGKRLRPVLMMTAYEGFTQADEKILHPALALEMIHTYSLIHDDLPAMDDDDLRRGFPTLHKQFDEATAILVGDGLLTYAIQLISFSPYLEAEEKVYITQQLSQAAGFEGMINGQHLDLKAENQAIAEDHLTQIHENKTGALIQTAIKIGAYLGNATPPQIEALKKLGYYLGLIFQIQDDILDVDGNAKVLGKPVGSDMVQNKSTYPKLLGLDGAIEKRNQYMEQAKQAYHDSGIEQPLFLDFIEVFGNRSY